MSNFLYLYILQIEESNIEVCEELYTAYTDLVSSTTSSRCNDFFFKTYNYGDTGAITLKETRALITEGTTGLRTWEVG